MLGAIVGDIVGSVYEFNNIKTKDFPLFRDDCFFTDDTVMTCAVAEAIMKGGKPDDFIDEMKRLGRLYPDAGYGGRFGAWVFSDDRAPYNSYGNGSAMRVSPCGWMNEGGYEAARLSAAVTHDHPEGIKGALATFEAISLARAGFRDDPAACKKTIRKQIEEKYGYDLSKTLDRIRPTYRFNETCQDTVPQALVAFLESTDFEDAIRNAISLGGDSDTLAAITGSVAEAAYGIPKPIANAALSYLDERLFDVVKRWYAYRAKWEHDHEFGVMLEKLLRRDENRTETE